MTDASSDIYGHSLEALGTLDASQTLSIYAQVLDNMAEGVSLSDERGIICYTNPTEDRMFGYARGELIGKHVSMQNTYPPDENSRIVNEVIGQLKTQGHWAGEFSNRKKDGTAFSTFARITAMQMGAERYWLCVQEDVTERKQAQEVLAIRVRQQEVVAKLGLRALAGTDIPSLLGDASALVASTLEVEYCKLLELLPDGDQLLLRAGWGWEEGLVGHATIAAGLDSQGGYTLASSQPVIVDDLRTETRFHTPSLLHDHQVVSGVSVIIHSHERPFGVLGAHTTQRRTFTVDDINFLQAIANVLAIAIERTRAEEELHASRNQLEVILRGVADGITVQNPSGQIIYANDAAVHMLGYASLAELLATPNRQILERFELLDEQYQPLPESRLPGRHALQGETGAQMIVGWRIRETGELRWSLVRSAPIWKSDGSNSEIRQFKGEVIMAVSIFHEITERIEEEKRKDSFIALASHELKTPITSLKLFAQMLRKRFERASDNELAQDAIRHFARMDEQLDKLTELVQDLLDVSKIGAGKLTYTMAEIDVDELVRETVEDIQRLADRHEIIVEGEATSKVTADPERIRQVLTNLITNAVKYSPDADKIIVGVKSEGSGVEKSEADVVPEEITVWVQDFGVGIPRSEQEKIFDRFYQVNDVSRGSRDTYPGLGLGLYISAEIVKRHVGRIWVESKVGEGSTFYFTLPLQTQA
jgi:PAS domain S-box-containing protein